MSSSFLSLKQSVMTHDICVNIYPSRHCLRSSSPQIKYYLLTLLQAEFHFSKGILLIEISFLIPSISLSRSTDLGKIMSAISVPKDGDPHLPLKTYVFHINYLFLTDLFNPKWLNFLKNTEPMTQISSTRHTAFTFWMVRTCLNGGSVVVKALGRQSKCYQVVALILKPLLFEVILHMKCLFGVFVSLPLFWDVYLLSFTFMERLSHSNHCF